MGMSASQVRFLSLQTRKNNIGNELATLANRKSSLARDMKVVSAKYDNATNRTKLQWSYDSGETYNNISYDLLMRPNLMNSSVPYIITDGASGKVVLNNDVVLDVDGNPIMVPDHMVDVSVNWAGVDPHDPTSHPTYTKTTYYDDKPLTYVTLARMISEYVEPTPSSNGFGVGETQYMNEISQYEHSGYYFPSDVPYEYDTSASTMSGEANPNAYVVPKDFNDFSAMNSLRMQMFKRLGIVSDEKIEKFNTTLAKLYGNEAAYNSGIYPTDCAMGQYYLALANRDAFRNSLNQTFNYVLDGNNVSAFDINIYSGDYTYNNKNVGGTTVITQTFNSTISDGGSAISHLSFDNFDSANDSSVTYSLENGITYNRTVTAAGIQYTFSIGDIIGTTEANKGSSINPVKTQKTYTSTSDTTTDGPLVISHTTYPDVSSVSVTGHTNSHQIMFSAISNTVYNAINTLIGDFKTNSYISFDNVILNEIKQKITDQVDSQGSLTYLITTTDTFLYPASQKLLAQAAQNDDFHTNTHNDGVPEVFTKIKASTSDAGFAFAYAYYNVDNMKKYFLEKYSIYSGAQNTNTWNSKMQYSEILANKLDEEVENANNKVNNLKAELEAIFTASESKQMDYFDALFLKIAQSGWIQDKSTSNEQGKKAGEYLENKLDNNIYFITECKSNGTGAGYEFTTKMAKNVSRVFNVHMVDEEGIALSQYEAEKTEINMKEQKIDVIMNKLETEQQAIETEMTSLEKQIGDNVQAVFKMFA